MLNTVHMILEYKKSKYSTAQFFLKWPLIKEPGLELYYMIAYVLYWNKRPGYLFWGKKVVSAIHIKPPK